jgi:hypothetical protein
MTAIHIHHGVFSVVAPLDGFRFLVVTGSAEGGAAVVALMV